MGRNVGLARSVTRTHGHAGIVPYRQENLFLFLPRFGLKLVHHETDRVALPFVPVLFLY